MTENGAKFEDLEVNPHNFAHLIDFVDKNMISSAAAKAVLAEIFLSGADSEIVIKEKNLFQVSDLKDLADIIAKIIADNPKVVEDYKRGKETVLQFLVGQVMKESQGRANPKIVMEWLKSHLDKIE